MSSMSSSLPASPAPFSPPRLPGLRNPMFSGTLVLMGLTTALYVGDMALARQQHFASGGSGTLGPADTPPR